MILISLSLAILACWLHPRHRHSVDLLERFVDLRFVVWGWAEDRSRTLSRSRSSQLLQPALLRGGTFDSKRVLYVHARDGLEDKLEPDDIGACLALPVSTLRKATLTAISDILKKLGEVMDTSAERGQERFLLFAALELTSAGAAQARALSV